MHGVDATTFATISDTSIDTSSETSIASNETMTSNIVSSVSGMNPNDDSSIATTSNGLIEES